MKCYYAKAIQNIANKKFYAFRDTTTNRLHTNLTSFPKVLIPYLTYKGEQLAEADFSNSQMFFFSSCLESSNNPFYKIFGKDILESTTLVFIEKSRKGELYEYLAKSFDMSRDEVKRQLIRSLFNKKIGVSNDSQFKAKLRKLFPQVVDMMDEFKYHHGYKELACELQRVESRLVLDLVLPKLRENGFHILTKHDCFLFPVSQLAKFKKVAAYTIIETIGQHHLKFQTFNKPNN